MTKKILNKITLIILLLSIYFGAFAQNSNQGIPIFENYYNSENSLRNQKILTISQNNDGVLFFGGNQNLFTYNGANWELIDIGESLFNAMAFNSIENRMYVGTSKNFGYIELKNDGKYEYINLSKEITDLRIKTTTKIITDSTGIFFFINKKIVFYNNKNLTVLKNPNKLNVNNGFKVFENIYTVDNKQGICLVNKHKIELIANTEEISKHKIKSILEFNPDNILVATNDNGFYILNKKNNNIKKLSSKVDVYFKEHQLYTGIKTINGYAFATVSGGVVMLDNNLDVDYIINKNSGLLSNAIYDIFADKNNNLWLATSKGATQIYMGTNLTIFSENFGFSGSITNFKILDYKILVGTDEGLFVNYFGNNFLFQHKFKTISANKTHFSDFKVITTPYSDEKVILTFSLNEIFTIGKDDSLTSVSDLHAIQSVSEVSENNFFFAHYEGCSQIKFDFDKNKYIIKQRNNIDIPDYIITSTCIDNFENLWFSSIDNGIAFLDINKVGLDKWIPIWLDTASGLPSNLLNKVFFVDKKLFVATKQGLYEAEKEFINTNNYKFVASKNYGLDFSKDSIIVYNLKQDKNGNIWLSTSEGFKKYDTNNQLISNPFIGATGNFEQSKIEIELPNIIWFSTDVAIYRFVDKDFVKKSNILSDVLITKAFDDEKIFVFKKNINANDYIYISDSVVELKSIVNSKNNLLQFEYALPFYEKSLNTKYSSKLVGYNKEWSLWSQKNNVLYKNLPVGKYEFKVIAKNSYNEISNVSTLIFEIKRSWYKSIYALIIYVFFILTIIIFGFMKFSQINKKKKNGLKNRLNKIISHKVSKLEFKEEEIKLQSKNLEIDKEKFEKEANDMHLKNSELTYLSLVAKRTNNSILLLDKRGKFEWWNYGFTTLFHYKYEKFKNEKFKVKQQKLRPDLKKLIRNYSKDQGRINYSMHEKYENGEEIWYQTTIHPVLDEKGFIVRFVVIDKDITDVKLLEIENSKLIKEISNYKIQIDILIANDLFQGSINSENLKAISSSIDFAKKIQVGLCLGPEYLDSILNDHFILNQPKDIVSGDFYWFDKKENRIIGVVADCSGHGIPGAIMGILGMSTIKEVLYKTKQTQANLILEEFRELILKSLNKTISFDNNNEIIDIALCIIDVENNKLQYSGANNPIYIIRKNELTDCKPERFTIGNMHNRERPFINKEFEIQTNDKIYLFTDGFYDQFGGLKNKKFYFANFRKLILSIHKLEMQTQKEKLIKHFYKWKGENFQVDDILVVGLTV